LTLAADRLDFDSHASIVEVEPVTATRARTTDLARVFKALGDPTRLAIYEIVREEADPREGHSSTEIENTISQIAARFDLTLSTVSHHIKELRGAGLIRCERRGQSIYCSTDPELLEEVQSFLAKR
jgi:ArsR family transcriptional regulator, arsenate/arsenite/antimonite-responsive transcriptional repressor